ncbi:hypothetical protein [Paenibacillus phoenicis]|uniref:hypothetical protein n=1 Tax=Paenibacillus phoenicis TaxID=554117 RepID=UPI003D26810A
MLGIDLDRITAGQDHQLQAAGCDAPPDRDEYRLLCSSVSHRKRSQNGGFQQKLFLLIHMTLFFVQLMFLAIGMASSVFFAKLRSVLPLSLGVVIGLYLIGALLASGEDKEMIRFISPFKYFALKAYLRGLIIRSVCMFLLVVSGMSKYSALLKSRRSVDFLPCCFCILS